MNPKRIQTALFTLIISLLPALVSNAASVKPFAPGERLVYDLTWFGISVGTGKLEVEAREIFKDKDTYRIVSTARSNSFISKFFPVEDRVESIIDATDIFSYYILINQRHGSRRVKKEIVFDQINREATLMYKGKERTFTIPDRVQDSLSSLYFFRSMDDLRVGQSVFIDVHESKKNWRMEVEILKKEKITVPMGSFDTLKIKAKVRYEGVLMDKGDVYIWVTDDHRKIPVLMKGKVSIGPFTASLSSGALPALMTSTR